MKHGPRSRSTRALVRDPYDPLGRRRQTGVLLPELLVALLLGALLLGALASSISHMASGFRLRLAVAEVVGALHRARSQAILLGMPVGIRFGIAGGRVTYRLFLDGDGDGVLRRDVEAGVDPPLEPAQRLGHLGTDVRLGFPARPPAFDPGGRRLQKLDDPVRFNRSDTASFSPLGTSTPGSLYLTDERERLAAVRVNGSTGKPRVLYWRPEEGLWR